MSIYGTLFNNNTNSIIEESINEEIMNEDTILSSVLEQSVLSESKIPQELRISDPNEVKSASKFKEKTKKIIEFMEKDGWTEKKISASVYGFYYAIIGNTFDDPKSTKYEPKLVYYVDLVNKYCIEKHSSKVKKDMDKTLAMFKKMEDNNKTFTTLQTLYYKDLKSARPKLK